MFRFQAISSGSIECVDVLLRSGAHIDKKVVSSAKRMVDIIGIQRHQELKMKITEATFDQVRFS